ncbi:MAG: FtsQ-type POTRA domain-containing protein [Dehalococcoidia bacterium]|nr:FtsQ-type POTRA domain-containing protein [Dehalococcoidia bacterium]
MIVRRGRPPRRESPRAIVKRSRTTVGEHARRAIIRRPLGVQPPRGGGPRWPRLPIPHFGRGRLVLLGVLAGVGLLVASGVWLWQSPIFKVQHIRVDGNERILADTIVERTNLLGQSMFEADLAAAQKALFALPLVAAVQIERQWPSTIRIHVEERKAWGTWEQGGVRYTIDRDGVVLGTVPPPAGSPVIRSSELGSRQQGDRVDYQAVEAAAEIYEQLPRQLGTIVKEVAFLAGKGVQVTTADGQSALFGDSSAIPYKLAVWAAMAQQAQARHISYTTVDLRFGNRPVLQ